MKMLILLSFALFLIFQTAEIAEAMDGFTWSSFGKPQKHWFVMGWISAGNAVTSKLAATLFWVKDKEVGQKLSVASWERAIEKFRKIEG